MTKTIGLLLAVVAIWATVEIYVNGTEGAFDGKLAALTGNGGEAPQKVRPSTPKRAGAAVERAHQASEERYDRLLGD